MIKVLVVDDEPLAREELRRLISQEIDFEAAGEAATGEEALQKIRAGKIDVVFLDIEMPGLNGLDVATKLLDVEENPPLIVFATAFHQYAIEAFEANAIDYILKPYQPERLKKTFERIKCVHQAGESSREKLISLESELIRQGHIKKIVGHKKRAKDRVVIDPGEVCFFSVKYTEVIAHLEKEDYVVSSTLKELLQNLDGERFAQTHKGHIVNIDKIEKVSPMFSGNFHITLKGEKGVQIPLSRRYAKKIKALISNW